jgi:poly-gamma-glutamate capsule biosynthesis protein CapA/YwtB (metallophosphatase superfamily)
LRATRPKTYAPRIMSGNPALILISSIITGLWLFATPDTSLAIGTDRKEEMTKQETINLFLCGDVMTGRGIDQILAHPVDPQLHESHVRDARDYVKLAERVNGPLTIPAEPSYIWGDALQVLADARPDLRIINLETSITTSDDYLPKGINYRMHPANSGVLTAANIDCCVLANNHVLDWGYDGLRETLNTLDRVGIRQAGAGLNLKQAVLPAIFEIAGKGRVLIFAYGSTTSGIPYDWEASSARPGINVLPDLSDATVDRIKNSVAAVRQSGDIVLFSIHWGGNWGYDIPEKQRRFAHRLIDRAGVDLVYGHSSHHGKGIEVYRNKLILYGCGDFLNDYEGIRGYEQFRDDLTLMYFPRLDWETGRLEELRMVPMQIKRFRTVHPDQADVRWLQGVLNREGTGLNTGVRLNPDNSLNLLWNEE